MRLPTRLGHLGAALVASSSLVGLALVAGAIPSSPSHPSLGLVSVHSPPVAPTPDPALDLVQGAPHAPRSPTPAQRLAQRRHAADLRLLGGLSTVDAVRFRAWVDPVFRGHLAALVAYLAPKPTPMPAPVHHSSWHPSPPAAPTVTATTNTSSVVVPTPAVNATGSVNGYPCGGNLPSCCTLQHESGGNPTAQNPSSSASGLWQFMHDTWAGFGGYSEAKYAPAAVQNARAIEVFAGGAGASNWYGDGCYNGR